METHTKRHKDPPDMFSYQRSKIRKTERQEFTFKGESIPLSYWVLMSVFVQIPRSIEAPLWFGSGFCGITTLRHRVKLHLHKEGYSESSRTNSKTLNIRKEPWTSAIHSVRENYYVSSMMLYEQCLWA